MMTSNAAVPEEVLIQEEVLRRDVVRDTVKVSWSSIIAKEEPMQTRRPEPNGRKASRGRLLVSAPSR